MKSLSDFKTEVTWQLIITVIKDNEKTVGVTKYYFSFTVVSIYFSWAFTEATSPHVTQPGKCFKFSSVEQKKDSKFTYY